MKKIIIAFAFLIGVQQSIAQSFKPIGIDIEWGVNFKAGDTKQFNDMRDCVDYFDYEYCGFFDGKYDNRKTCVTTIIAGIKPEFALNEHFALSVGARYSSSKSILHHTDGAMIWRCSQNGVNTDFVSVNRIRQTNQYLGVPIELRLAFASLFKASPYLKVGTSLNYRIATNNEADMKYEIMNKYTSVVEDNAGHGDDFTMPIWGAVGMQCGHQGAMCIELQFPYITENNQTSSFCDQKNLGVGIQISYRIPFFNNIIINDHE